MFGELHLSRENLGLEAQGEAVKYLKQRLKIAESQLFIEKKNSNEMKAMVSQSYQQRNKYYELTVTQQKQINALRREIGELKQRHSKELYQKNVYLSEMQRVTQQNKIQFQLQKNQLVKVLREDFEYRIQRLREEWFAQKEKQKNMKEESKKEKTNSRKMSNTQSTSELKNKYLNNFQIKQQTRTDSKQQIKRVKSKEKTSSTCKRSGKAQSQKQRRSSKKQLSQIIRLQKDTELIPQMKKQSKQIQQELIQLKAQYMSLLETRQNDEHNHQLQLLIKRIQQRTGAYIRAKQNQKR